MREIGLNSYQKFLFLISLIAALLLASCDRGTPPLNSERIQQRFGNYGVEILQSHPQLRISNLYSETDGRRTCRTYAIVEFAQPIDPAIAELHRKIESGQSIGTTLRDGGWTIEKRLEYIGDIAVTERQAKIAELMRIGIPTSLAMHIYGFVANKDGKSIEYATIVEIHHPDYLDSTELRAIYGEIDAPAPALPLILSPLEPAGT